MKAGPTLQPVKEVKIPARTGVALALSAGEYLRITDVKGQQPADFWAFNAEDTSEYLSPAHTRTYLSHLFPKLGQSFATNRRRPILQIVEDTVNVHDMIWAACDAIRYRNLGVEEWHPSCVENLTKALSELEVSIPFVSDVVNFFTSVKIGADGSLTMHEAPSTPGDYITLRAWIKCVVAISACPSDLTPVAGYRPTDLTATVLVEG